MTSTPPTSPTSGGAVRTWYVEPLRAVWPALVEPLAGSRGIGDHLSRLAAIRAAGTL